MNNYELCVIFKPSFSEEEVKEELDKVVSLIEGTGAKIDKIDSWGKRRLAYEIRVKRIKDGIFNDGIYYFITFFAEADALSILEQSLRINESVLRYLSIRKDA